MKASSLGYAGSRGTYAPPALRMPSSPTTISGAFDADADKLRSHSQRLKVMPDSLSGRSALGRSAAVFKDYRNSVGSSLYLGLKQLMDTRILRIICLGVIPLHQQLMPLGYRQQRQFCKMLLWISDPSSNV